MGELNQKQDFFFNNTTTSSSCISKSSNSSMLDHDHNHMIKKETSHDKDHHHHDIGLNLFPCVAASSGSKSISASDKVSIDKLSILKSEVKRINVENQYLKDKLNQVGNNYRALHGHILTLSRNQQYGNKTTNHFKPTNRDKCNERANVQDREFSDGFLKSKDVDDDDNRDHDHDRMEDQTKMARRARVSVRTCYGESMISDGCQWRKYGQKMSKGNPCPRAYYRCTMAIGCPVRKQVQRCLEEQSILITTYEGNHNHPLPPSAVEMASTTSAAASMLLSGSIQSADHNYNYNHNPLVNSSNNHHLLSRTMLPYLPHMASISSSTPFPTITLDLTTTSNGSQTIGSKVSNLFPQNISISHETLGPIESFMNTNTNQNNSARFPLRCLDEQNQQMIDVLTTAIASDPNFASTIAAAVSSIINNSGANKQRNDNME